MKFPKLTPASARAAILLMSWLLVLIVLGMLVWVEDLRENETFRMLAQAIVTQGFFGLIVAFYFTASDSKSDHIHEGD